MRRRLLWQLLLVAFLLFALAVRHQRGQGVPG